MKTILIAYDGPANHKRLRSALVRRGVCVINTAPWLHHGGGADHGEA